MATDAALVPLASEYATELAAAVDAVALASRLCQAVQARLQTDEHTEKEDESPVTVADYGAQALVTWSLLRSLPGQALSMVAEEDAADLRAPGGANMLARITQLVNATLAAHSPPGSGAPSAALSEADVLALVDRGGSEGGAAGRHWVLDPIDGTRGFVGGRQYAVCLGLLSEGAAVLGVLGCPNLPRERIAPGDCAEGQAGRAAAGDDVGVIFAAARGAGAYAGPIYGGMPTERVRCAAEGGAPPRVMESFDSRHSDHDLGSVLAREIGAAQPSLRLDSQAKYGLLSRGDASVFMRFPSPTYKEKIWDHCAGTVIAEEAGAKVTDAEGSPLDYSRGRFFETLRGGGIVAAPPALHAALIEAVLKHKQ